jgi:hypothetical protein
MATTTSIIVVSIFFGGVLTNSVTRIFGVKTDIKELEGETSSTHPSLFRNGNRTRTQPSKGTIELKGKTSRGGIG